MGTLRAANEQRCEFNKVNCSNLFLISLGLNSLLIVLLTLVVREIFTKYPLSLNLDADSIPGVMQAYLLKVWAIIEAQVSTVEVVFGFSGLHLTAIMAVIVAGVWYMRR